MTTKDRVIALDILSGSNSVKVSFNVPMKDSYSHMYGIIIHKSNVSTIDALHDAGFKLSMTNKGLHVDKY